MIFILRAELYKILGYKAFRYLIAGYLVTLCSAAYIGDSFVQQFVKKSNPGESSPAFSISEYWNALLWLGQFFHLYLGVVLIMLICNEWETRTMRQQIMSGLTEMQVVFCKVFNSSLFLFIPVFTILLLGLALGEGLGEASGTETVTLFFYFYIKGMGIMAFSAMLAFWLKKPAPAILFLIGYYFILESILGMIVDHYLPGYSIALPLKSFNALANYEADSDFVFQAKSLLLLTVTYICVFWSLSLLRIRRYDV